MNDNHDKPKFALKAYARVSPRANLKPLEGTKVWVYAMFDKDDMRTPEMRDFPAGRVYLVEDEDGFTVWIHEDHLDPV